MSDDIEFRERDGLGVVVLNRPEALNALSIEMIAALDEKLVAWAGDERIGAVLIRKAEGRAFAAGGDIQRLWQAGKDGDLYTRDFFWDEYIANWRVHHYPKPYVALIDGITMGGGVGISVLGSHRVATENTQFAMPETGIGFFPDVGATWLLPRLPGFLGRYLALTGARLGGAECVHAGIATCYTASGTLGELENALAAADLAAADAEGRRGKVDHILARFCSEPGPAPIADLQTAIDRLFGGGSVPEIVAALEADGSAWARETLETIRTKSPTSLAVAFEQLRRGESLSLDEALTLEYRMSQAFMAGHDFFEGVRALIVDKDRKPHWRPATLEEVSAADVARHFEPPEGGDLTFDDPRRRFGTGG
jgi:enoyl-CoA hydratase